MAVTSFEKPAQRVIEAVFLYRRNVENEKIALPYGKRYGILNN